ncbi:MAG TPA: polysaccharide deacetylase family protein, partial [Vicinamibacterales bacterium]
MKSPAQSETPIVNAMTVDVEDYFHVSAFENTVSRSQWETLDSRVSRNTERLLELFDRANVRATFFVLGWVAERFPGLVRDIAARGHEIGSHGFSHRLVYDQTPE